MSTSPQTPPATTAAADSRPRLLFFYRATSGSARRTEAHLAQVLQRRKNHDTFRLHRIDIDAHPDLAHRCGITTTPALVLLENTHIRARLQQPKGCTEIQSTLAPWLK